MVSGDTPQAGDVSGWVNIAEATNTEESTVELVLKLRKKRKTVPNLFGMERILLKLEKQVPKAKTSVMWRQSQQALLEKPRSTKKTSTPAPKPTETSTPAPEPTKKATAPELQNQLRQALPTPEPTEAGTPTPEPTETSTPTPEPTETSTPTPEPSETIAPTESQLQQ